LFGSRHDVVGVLWYIFIMDAQVPSESTTPPQAQTSQPPITEQEKASHRPMLIIIAIVVLLIVGMFGGYFFIQQNKQSTTTLPTTQVTLQPTTAFQPTIKQPSPTVQVDETSGWKTYADEKYEFKYPSNLIINDEKDWNGFYFYNDQNSAEKTGNPHEKGALFSVDVSVEDKSTYKTIREQEREQDVPENYSHITEYRDSQGRVWTFNGSVWGEGDSSGITADINYQNKYYLVGSSMFGRNYGQYINKELIIESSSGNFDATPLLKEHDELMQKILSTFKFID
jgi:hypothetical protein